MDTSAGAGRRDPARDIDETEPLSTRVVDRDAVTLADRLAAEMAEAWRHGRRPRVEEYLDRHPRLAESPDAVIQLVNEEVCLREDAGEEVPSSELRARFPRWRDRIDVLLHCHELLAEPTGPRFPETGERLGEFRLLGELGRGALGRVFLARQASMSSRLVVLKITPLDGSEHLLLSRLQHTHIVPVYAVEAFPERQIQAFCMPWLGGTTLFRLMGKLKDRPAAERRPGELLRVLDEFRASRREEAARTTAARDFLATAAYADAVCWIGAALADALQYVHDRQLVHLDIKPSNVLLTADGQPMLLDFHLASEPFAVGTRLHRGFGGTPGYMAPEHQQAMAAARVGDGVPSGIDGRADIYALGVILHEALGGEPPQPGQRTFARLDRVNREVSVGLADIVRKCLALDPAERYPSAGLLAEDLRRHLRHLPLRGVRNRSLAERWRKWRRRRPADLTVFALLVLVGVAAAAAAAAGWHSVGERESLARAALDDARRLTGRGDYVGAVEALRRGERALPPWPFGANLERDFADARQTVHVARQAAELREIVDRLRFAAAEEDSRHGGLRELVEGASALWDSRRELVALPGGVDDVAELREDLRDFGTLYASLLVRLEPGTASRRAALRILTEAEEIAGPSVPLLLERREQADALGETAASRAAREQLRELGPEEEWEHLHLGRSRLEAGRPAEAAASLERIVRARPEQFWPRFYIGTALLRVNRAGDALQAFEVCVALRPDQAECYYNRALAHAARGDHTRAVEDCTRALELDAGLQAALVHRAVVHGRVGNRRGSRADLDAALKLGETAEIHHLLAELSREEGDTGAARRHVEQALRLEPGYVPALELRRQLTRAH